MFRILIVSIIFTSAVFTQQSPDGMYRVEQERRISDDINDEQLVIYTVLDRDDREVYSVTREATYDAAFPSVGIFNSGKLVIIASFPGIVEFYDTNGEQLRLNTFPGADDVEHERKIDFSLHNNRAAFIVSEPAYNDSRLVVFDETGQLLLMKKIDAPYTTGIVYSPHGSLLAVGTYSWVGKSLEENSYFLTNEGEIVGNVDTGFQNGLFSDDEVYFIGYSNSHAHLIHVGENEVLWSHEREDDEIIIQAAWHSTGVLLLTSDKPALHDGKWMYKNPIVRTLEATHGNVIAERRFPDLSFTSGNFQTDNDEIMLKLDDSVHILERN